MLDMQKGRMGHVAVVGAGPAGLYATEALVKKGAQVDVFERLFAPHGLVRYGVAPDHQKIKKTSAVFDRILEKEGVRFFGNVQVGQDVSVDELLAHYDQVLIAMGSSAARSLGVEGESLRGSLTAPGFVGWYNGHPDYADLDPPLDTRAAVVVGMGNVAIDVARVLLQEHSVLAKTDIAPQALSALRKSQVSEVTLLARRGPDQAACDMKEVRDLLTLSDVHVQVSGCLERPTTEKGRMFAELPRADAITSGRRIVLRFCASPLEMLGHEGRLHQIRLEDNELVQTAARVRAVGTGRTEVVEAGLCIVAIGYRGEPLPGVPFDERSATIPNDQGQVLTHPTGTHVPGLFVAGWIKRGATGLIGTNKACAQETIQTMESSSSRKREPRNPDGIELLLAQRKVPVIDWPTWKHLDVWEREKGKARGAVRQKLGSVAEVLEVLERSPPN